MLGISLLEALLLFAAIALWGLSPRSPMAREGCNLAFFTVCAVGALVNYSYLLTVPTEKTVLPLFVIEKRDYGVLSLDFGQIFILLMVTHIIYVKWLRRRAKSAEERAIEKPEGIL